MSEEEDKCPLVKIDFSGMGEAVKALVDKLARGAHIVYEPRATIKKAEADVIAKHIYDNGIDGICDVQKRGIIRHAAREGRRQRNIENIVIGSLDLVEQTAKPDNMDDDWLDFFVDKCSSVSNPEMQSLWSRILAGEANKVGSFSKRTLEFVSTMSKFEAEQFTSLCEFCIEIDGFFAVYVERINEQSPHGTELCYAYYKELDAIGLITLDTSLHLPLQDTIEVVYFGKKYTSMLSVGSKLDLGQVALTSMGRELVSVCQAKENSSFLESIIGKWQLCEDHETAV